MCNASDCMCRTWYNSASSQTVNDVFVKDCSWPDSEPMMVVNLSVHSNAHKVIAGFFLSPDPEVT
jgi:hypothetical protein